MTRRKRLLTYDRAVQQWLNHLQDERGASTRTIDSYEKTLAYAREILGSDVDPLGITRDDLQDCLAAWRHLAAGTRATRISTLRSFFDWLAEEHGRAQPGYQNPAQRLRRPRAQRAARRRLTQADVEAMLAAAARPDDRLVTLLLALTGIRRSELLALRWRDLDLDERALRVVKGKGGKGREVPIPQLLAEHLRDRRARLTEHGQAKPSDHVCQGRRGGPLSPATPNHILQRVARLAGIDDADHVGPHDLRRAYATIFQRANPGDLVRLQAAMGHASLSTTRVYIADAEQRSIRAAADAAFADFVTPDEGAFGALGVPPAISENPDGESSVRTSATERPTSSEGSEHPGALVRPPKEDA